MSIGEYASFMAITIGAIIITMRALFFLMDKQDPIKAVLPDVARWAMMFEKKKKVQSAIDANS